MDKIQIEECEIARADADSEGIPVLNMREADEISHEDLEAAAAFWDHQVSLGRAKPIFPINS